MPLEHIVLYECDGPRCEERGSPVEVKYFGKYPKDWLHLRVAVWPKIEQGQQGGLAFHTRQCMVEWLMVHIYDDESVQGKDIDNTIKFLREWKADHI